MRKPCLQDNAEGDAETWIRRQEIYLGKPGKLMANKCSGRERRKPVNKGYVCLVKAMVFPLVMYGCESWIIKKAERQKIVAFELWCWRRLLRVPWTVKRSNQSILKDQSWVFIGRTDV